MLNIVMNENDNQTKKKNSKYVCVDSKLSIFSCYIEICRFYAIKRSKWNQLNNSLN